MTSKFDDDDINDEDLLAACNEIPDEGKIIEPSVEVSKFGFPFDPYSIQVDFMRGLYATIYRRKHGIFESPTGTVIDLSI